MRSAAMNVGNPYEPPGTDHSPRNQPERRSSTIFERSIVGGALAMVAVFAYTVVVPVPIGLAIVSPIAALIAGALAICVVNLIARAVK
ncbi:MAG: hypothetical protein KDB05_32155, partial [Planctomycetales bacterium]|nr:hypothetical protein [Planctomycetales bacterium]